MTIAYPHSPIHVTSGIGVYAAGALRCLRILAREAWLFLCLPNG